MTPLHGEEKPATQEGYARSAHQPLRNYGLQGNYKFFKNLLHVNTGSSVTLALCL